MSLYLNFCLSCSVCLSLCVSDSLSVCLSLSNSLPVSPSDYLPVCPPMSVSACLNLTHQQTPTDADVINLPLVPVLIICQPPSTALLNAHKEVDYKANLLLTQRFLHKTQQLIRNTQVLIGHSRCQIQVDGSQQHSTTPLTYSPIFSRSLLECPAVCGVHTSNDDCVRIA